MTTRNTYALTILTLLMLFYQPAVAQYDLAYSKDTPVLIVCDWDFPPYEYSNNSGEPDGYNIELLRTIFKKIDIPCRFLLKEWSEATHAFEQRQADLIIDPSYHYRSLPYIRSANILNYYKVLLVRGAGARTVSRLDEFTKDDTLILKRDDYAANRIVEERQMDIPIEYHSPKEALAGISDGRYRYFIWGEGPLMWKKKELALDSLLTSPLDIPDGEIRIIGYDKQLIDAIDDEFARMEQSGELQQIHDKWFHPERLHDSTSPIAIFVLVGAVVASIIGLLLSRLVRTRVQMAVNRSADLNNMMQQALKMGHYDVILFDTATHTSHNVHGHLLPDEGYSREEFFSRVHPENREVFRLNIDAMIQDRLSQWSYTWRMNQGTESEPDWHWLHGTAAIEDTKGTARQIVYTVKDVTRQVEEERINSELSTKYMKIFETNLVAISVFDKDGRFIDMNENMRLLCRYSAQNQHLFRTTNLSDIALIKGLYPHGSHSVLHVCQHMLIPETGADRYVELRITPAFDDNRQLQYYVITCRDITEERTLTLSQHRHNQEMQKTGAAINQYEAQLQYLLNNTQMFIWNYYPDTGQIVYTHSSRSNQYFETLEEFFQGLDSENREAALADIRACVSDQRPYDAIHHYQYTPLEHHPVWYAISGIPTYNRQGLLVNYFGIARNITTLMQAQQRLRVETSRAENSGHMKSAFLANMTHEIRTPLNAIVGFSDLLPVVETQQERIEFIRIIRNNCDMLMRLINDILEASSMGQALAIQPAEVDFSQVFDDLCQTLAQRVQQPGVQFIKDNPYPHCLTSLDKGRIQQVLTNFVTNAVKYTHQGYIKVGYHWDRRQKADGSGETDGLLFYSMDTGAGIPKEKQASVFERFVKLDDFVQGTGLGLSICQNIANSCNGQIGVTSDGPGCGSTFWMWIPCPRL